MTFEWEMGELGRATAGLLLASPRVPAPSLPAAVTAQAASYHLLHQVHRGLAGATRTRSEATSLIGRHPVAALGRLLEKTARTRPPGPSTLDVLTAAPTSEADALWHAVLRHASLATIRWQERDSTPTGDAAWSLIGDIATLSQAASALDRDLAGALAASGRQVDADAIMHGPSLQLGLAGVVSAALAAGGPQPPAAVASPPPRRPVVVASAESVADGQRRLARFLRDPVDVSPHSVFVVEALTGQSALTATEHASSPAVSDALREHAHRLAEVASRPGRCATVRPSDPRPEAQAYEIRRYLRSLHPGTEAASDAAEAFASGLGAVANALAACAQRQERQGRWLVPAAEVGKVIWQRSGNDTELAPPFIAELARLAGDAARDARLPNSDPPLTTDHARLVAPARATLVAPLRSAGLPPVRPAVPSHPPSFGRGR